MFVRFRPVLALFVLFHPAHGYVTRKQESALEKAWIQILGQPNNLLKTPDFLNQVQMHLRDYYDGLGRKKNLSEKHQQLVRLYQNRDFKPIWLNRNGWTLGVQAALETLENADREGLNPADYTGTCARVKTAVLDAHHPEQLAALDSALSASVLDYIDDLAGERLTPHTVNGQLFIKPTHIDAGAVLERGLGVDGTAGFLKDLTVPFPDYQALKKELARLKEAEKQNPWPVNLILPAPQKKLTLGDRGGAVGILKKQLAAHGLLKTAEGDVFDDQVLTAVKAYQYNHTLEVDGVVGYETAGSLNTPVSKRIDQVIVTLERWRWVPDPLPARIVMVNTAGYMLRGFDHGKETLAMRVIIGQKYRKTPVFASEIDLVRYNPAWYVPRSIAVKDKLPAIQKDPSYLARKGFVVTDSDGNAVNAASVDWSSVSADHFPYRLRQNPGSMNALGKLFFHINTPFGIFLHSTPDQDLFNKTKRSLSSGCIRVERPADLAFFVFNDPSVWPLNAIHAAMVGTRTQDVQLRHKVPVYIGYFTVYLDFDGKLRYGEDFYGQDAAILKALQDKRQKMYTIS